MNKKSFIPVSLAIGSSVIGGCAQQKAEKPADNERPNIL